MSYRLHENNLRDLSGILSYVGSKLLTLYGIINMINEHMVCELPDKPHFDNTGVQEHLSFDEEDINLIGICGASNQLMHRPLLSRS